MLKRNATILIVIGLSGCTWVKRISEGESVTMARSVDTTCKKAGDHQVHQSFGDCQY